MSLYADGKPVGAVIYDSTNADHIGNGFGDIIYLKHGVWIVEAVTTNIGAATVQVEQTLDKDDLANFKTNTDLLLDSTKQWDVMRGGTYMRVVVAGSPTSSMKVRAHLASSAGH